MRTITLEEHYTSPAFQQGPGRGRAEQAQQAGENSWFAKVIRQLGDVGDGRIADMDAAGIDVQVLSLSNPGVQQLDAAEAVPMAREANDYLAETVRRHPSRFAGFAALPTAAPEAAADELERTVRAYGFKGAMIDGHTRGRYLDDPFFWPILERAEALRVPIYLHPTAPPPAVIAASFTGHFSPQATFGLSTSAWGWHIETANHVLRLILGGAFDRYPDFQLIIGHLGEGLPFMMQRLEHGLSEPVARLQRPVAAYLRENVHYTFSGLNSASAFLCLLLEVGVERIMFSADHPFASMAEARAFLDQLPVSPADRERIAHGNAERLLQM